MTGVRRRGLRTSVTLAFAAGALTLSTALALGTYFSARHYLIDQRERTATRQAFTDGALVRNALRTSDTTVSEALGSVNPPAGAVMYLHRRGEWFSSALDTAGPDLTELVQPAVAEGSAGIGWTEAIRPSAVIVGVPLPAVGAEYYEVSVADELHRTLRTLAIALAICAGVTTLGGAALGRAASRRLLAPLHEVTGAAVRVSAGDLDTRLQATEDPDLAAFVGSFNHMVDALHRRIEQDARFAADVSHELRTPVTTLTNSLALLERTPDLSPRSEAAIRLMSNELTRFRQALDDLLALGRLDAGVHEAAPQLTDAHELVRQALEAAGKSGDLLTARPREGDGAMLRIDRLQMLRVLVNLFRNADLHGAGLTGVAVVDRGDVVDLVVEDRGPGIPTADRRRIFERFARAGGQKTGTGSGLGLSIVQQAVHNHGGEVWCTDRPEGGTRFVIRLPSARGVLH